MPFININLVLNVALDKHFANIQTAKKKHEGWSTIIDIGYEKMVILMNCFSW